MANLIKYIVDRGITGVENIHNSISMLIFSTISKVKPITETTKTVENIHNITIDSVFDNMRKINNELGNWSTRVLQKDKEKQNNNIDFVKK
jgi:hypothetical protein